ncbi:plasma membrane localization protein [Coemansia sp. RSA 552]|nr:plasma membrane localization protein [Coemansia sp. RSA 552]
MALELPPPPSPRDSPSTVDERRAVPRLGCMPGPCLSCLRRQASAPAPKRYHHHRPPLDFVLLRPLLRRYVKHASLVERCFPLATPGAATPSSNELSYLVYYAQSKPAKLAKVGAYLSKRIARDVQRRRTADARVGLGIYDELLRACSRDLNFFARDVLGTLDTVLVADDPELTLAATTTFALFCRCHSGTSLAIDRDLCSLYSHLIRTYAGYAQASKPSAHAALGLCAMQAVAESQATYADDCYYELPRVVSAVASRIAAAPAASQPATASTVEEQIATVAQSDGGSAPSAGLLGAWAWRCFETLVRRSHGQHSHVIVAETFRFLDSRLEWQPTSLCVRVVLVAVAQLQPQVQNMVIVDTLALLTDGALSSRLLYLEDSSADSTAVASSNSEGKASSRRACMIRILERLFCKPYVLVGISVMEALNVLVAFLLESVVSEHLESPDQTLFATALKTVTGSDGPEPVCGGGPASDYYHLLAAIGGLAKHQYYSDQLSDMIGYLVSQIKLGVSDNQLVWLLQSLFVVLRACQLPAGMASQKPPSVLSLEVFAPLFTLLPHQHMDVRVLAADCITEALRSSAARESNGQLPPVHADLLGAAYRRLGDGLRETHGRIERGRVPGYAGAAAIIHELLKTQGAVSTPYTLALIGDCAPGNASKAWVTLLAIVWAQLASLHANQELGSLASTSKAKAKESGLWEDAVEHVCLQTVRVAEVASGSSSACSKADTPTNDAGMLTLLVKELDHSTVLELLSADAKLDEAEAPIPWTASGDAIDRVLRGSVPSEPGSVGPVRAVEQVQGIRARVSVDWEVQIRRDSIVAPHINVEQLRTALRDGLAMHADDRGGSSRDLQGSWESGLQVRRNSASDAFQSRDVLDTIGQSGMCSDTEDDDDDGSYNAGRAAVQDREPRVPDEVRDLLDSIGS